MKQFLFIYLFGVLYVLSPLWRDADGQYFEDPTKNFKPFMVEWVNRGSYNMSTCVNDLINCWEVIRGDVICSHNKYFETVCGLSREYCQDLIGDYDTYLWYYEFTLFENYCREHWDEYYT